MSVTGSATNNANSLEQEIPGWIWVLTIQERPQELENLMDEDDFDDIDLDGDIVGCYATKALMVADMKKLGANRYGMFHLKVEGWSDNVQLK